MRSIYVILMISRCKWHRLTAHTDFLLPVFTHASRIFKTESKKKDLFYCPTKISKILLPKHGLRRRQRGPVFPFDVMATSSEHFDEKMRKLHTHQISRHLALKLVVTQLQEL